MKYETKVIREYTVFDKNNNQIGKWNNPKNLVKDLNIHSTGLIYKSINDNVYIKNNKVDKKEYRIELKKEKKMFEIETERKKIDYSQYHLKTRNYIEEIPNDAKEVEIAQGLFIKPDGTVIGTDTNGYYIITPYLNKYKGVRHGYYKFHYNGKTFRLHYLLARLFVDGYKDGLVVDHIDNDSTNNDLSNLQWISRGANVEKFWNSLSDEEYNEYKKKYSDGLKKAHEAGKYEKHLKELHEEMEAMKIGISSGIFIPRELTEDEIDDLNNIFENKGE